MNRPLLLLLGTGGALGASFPFGKMAIAQGVNPVLWACLICLGAGVFTALVAGLRGEVGISPVVLRFAMISGVISNVVPHFLTFAAIPKIGSGLAAIMFALSPVMTAFLSVLLKVRPPNRLGLAGIALGLSGALVIIVGRNSDFSRGEFQWLLLSVLIPVFLGVGNVYRTLAWPEGASPILLAALTNLAAVPPLVILAWAYGGGLGLAALAAVPGLVCLQVAASSIMFLMFFRLQQLGGPTYLSQIGYVAAVVGVATGVLFLGESYPVLVWAGAAIIAAGIALTTIAQLRLLRR
jgi:drug/metabolite transporter (DMT)-like permease